MRILVVVSQYHRRAGFPRLGAQLATGLSARGHRVTVLTREAERGPADAAVTFESYSVPMGSTLGLLAWEPVVLTRRLRREASRFDVVVAVGLPVLAPVVLFGTGTHRGFFLATLSTLAPSSLRWWVERLRPFHRVVMAWERAMLRGGHPRLVVVGAEPFAREYVDLYGWPAERVVAVPLAVERAEFSFDPEARRQLRSAWGVPPEAPVLLNVAGRGRQKGLDVLVAALERLPRDRSWCAVLAGRGAESAELRSRTAALQADGRLRLVGRVADVRPLYSAADLLVFPSRYDPWGLVVTEALACGLPVVASARAGASVAVAEGVNGVLVGEPTDPVAVAAAIESVWERPWDRSRVAASVEWLGVERIAEMLEPHLTAARATTD